MEVFGCDVTLALPAVRVSAWDVADRAEREARLQSAPGLQVRAALESNTLAFRIGSILTLLTSCPAGSG